MEHLIGFKATRSAWQDFHAGVKNSNRDKRTSNLYNRLPADLKDLCRVISLTPPFLPEKGQAGSVAKEEQLNATSTIPFGTEAFNASSQTFLRWLGMAGYFINSRGTTMMIDPLLGGFDMPLLIDIPIAPKDVPRLDAVLVTHADNDHYSVLTNRDLLPVTRAYHSTLYVDSLMKNEGFPSAGHAIGETFRVGPVRVKLTPADHACQNAYPGMSKRFFKNEDACGFWIETPDGTIRAPGDSRLLPQHLQFSVPDAILFDFSDSEWLFTLEGAIKIANAYPNTPLLLNHWGSVDAPDFTPFKCAARGVSPLPGRQGIQVHSLPAA